jgi:hypothetical protein
MYLNWYMCRCGNAECSKSFARLAFLLAEIAKGPQSQVTDDIGGGNALCKPPSAPGLFDIPSPSSLKMERTASMGLASITPKEDTALIPSIPSFSTPSVPTEGLPSFGNTSSQSISFVAPALPSDTSTTSAKRPHSNVARGNQSSDLESPKKKRFKIDREADTPPRRLRCPYYQRDPEAHSRYSCRGSGFADMAKLKDHLKRAHTRPLRCTRCWENMASTAALDAHLRAESICRKRPEPDDDRICPRKLRDLNFNRNPFSGAESVEEKWQMLYKIIFPGDEEVPSAYEETDTAEKEMSLLAKKIEEEVCKLLRPILGDVVDFLKGMVMAVVQDCGEKVLGAKRDRKGRRSSSLNVVALDADVDSKLAPAPLLLDDQKAYDVALTPQPVSDKQCKVIVDKAKTCLTRIQYNVPQKTSSSIAIGWSMSRSDRPAHRLFFFKPCDSGFFAPIHLNLAQDTVLHCVHYLGDIFFPRLHVALYPIAACNFRYSL